MGTAFLVNVTTTVLIVLKLILFILFYFILICKYICIGKIEYIKRSVFLTK